MSWTDRAGAQPKWRLPPSPREGQARTRSKSARPLRGPSNHQGRGREGSRTQSSPRAGLCPWRGEVRKRAFPQRACLPRPKGRGHEAVLGDSRTHRRPFCFMSQAHTESA